jgi:hypothetical protein
VADEDKTEDTITPVVHAEKKTEELGMFPAIFTVLMAGGIGFSIAWRDPTGHYVIRQWWPLGVGVLALVSLALLFSPVRNRVKAATPRTRVGLFSFVVLPALFALVIAPAFLSPTKQSLLFRTLFLSVVCLFPGSMYYLFVAARRHSLINDFVICLERLGLLTKEAGESEGSHQRRIVTYLDKFEAVYGPVPAPYAQNLIERSRSSAAGALALDASRAPMLLTFETGIPVLIATVLITVGWAVTMPPIWDPSGSTLGLFAPARRPVNYAFLGAYFFSLQMLFRRYIRRDLQASAYASVSLRIILAVIGTWVVVEISNPALNSAKLVAKAENVSLVTGFIIGAFPSVFLQMIQAAGKRLGKAISLPRFQNELPLHDLDGLTIWHQARLEEEDIENIPNFATADCVELMVHTRFPPDRIVDWVNQSILYTVIGPESHQHPNRAALRAHGIRNAVAFLEAYRKSEVRGDEQAFEKLLPTQDRSVVRSFADTIEAHPNIRLIEAWHRIPKRHPLAIGAGPISLSA